MAAQSRRLYIFTGKGGVGKTTLSRAFVGHLNQQNKKAIYLTFQNQSLGEYHPGNSEKIVNGIKEISLDLEECARAYIEKKLGSKLVSSWIVKTPFFRALINMVPGFTYLIFLGKVLEMGNADPELTIVLDAPASGHALTMIESTTNFQEIFKSGVIFEDTSKMLNRLNDPNYTQIHVVTLPGVLAWQEAVELRESLKKRTPVGISITVNNCLYPLVADKIAELPPGLKDKALNEKKLLEQNQAQMHCVLPHSLAHNTSQIERELVGSLSKLV